jgi:hypothetical protein
LVGDGPFRAAAPWFLTVLVLASALRLSFAVPGVWQQPWTPHHADEHILPFEALALWEGVTPREVGWPASTTRVGLSALYAGDFLRTHAGTLRRAPNAAAALEIVSRSLSERIADPTPLYVIGRSFCAALGILQVLATAWAVSRWLPMSGALAGAILAATSPLLVLYSQYVLSDITGALFATLLIGCLPGATSGGAGRFVALGALSGLAAGSKFHFGLWVLPAVLVPWVSAGIGYRQRLTISTLIAMTFLVVLLVFVPWTWTNPVLMLKEFAGVVLAKAGTGAGGWGQSAHNVWMLVRGLGWGVVVTLLPGAWALIRRNSGLGLLVTGVTLGGLAALAESATVFDRYAIVLAPGALLMGAAGASWIAERTLGSAAGRRNIATAVLCGALLVEPVLAIRRASEAGSYHEAHEWMLAHLPDRAHVVIYSEDNQYLPHTSEQLSACAARVWSEEAYAEKWATNGVRLVDPHALAMRQAILADEFFHAFWCLRELDTPRPVSFTVERFHRDPRFETLTVETVQAEFTAGLTDQSRGFDAVLIHFPLTATIQPARIFMSGPGPRLLLYLRPGLVLRDDAESGAAQ